MSLFSRILPKKEDFFGTKKLIHATGSYEVFYSERKDENYCTFKYSDKKVAKRIGHLLKSVKNSNILDIKAVKDGEIKTGCLVPLRDELSSCSDTFKEYLIIVLERTLDFLHLKCSILHKNIILESIYLNETTGSLVLAGFERSEKKNEQSDFSLDREQFNEVSYQILGNYETEDPENNFYLWFFEQLVLFPVMKEYEIIKFLNSVQKEQKSNGIPNIVKKALSIVLLNKFEEIKEIRADTVPTHLKKIVEIGNIQNLQHQKYIFLYFIMSLDLDSYNNIFTSFINVMDTNFRIEVLSHQEYFSKKVSNWSDKTLFGNISIGLRCKVEKLQLLTINLFQNTLSQYKKSQIKEITKLLSFCKVKPAIALINTNLPVFIENDLKGLFKLQFVFLESRDLRENALFLVQKTYKLFDLKQICTELLPFLCEMIIETPVDVLFDTISQILTHLKANKEKILESNIETRLNKWIPFLKKSKSKSENLSEMSNSDIPKPEDTVKSDEWEDEW